MREIPLTNGGVALVDDADYERLARHAWYRHPQGYATRREGCRTIYMHHEVLAPVAGLETDHIDRNGLNNRRVNLRNVTHAENMRNRRPNRISCKGRKARTFGQA